MKSIFPTVCACVLSVGSASSATLTFDDLPSAPSIDRWSVIPAIPTNYAGFQWTGFGVLDAAHSRGAYYPSGLVSSNNVLLLSGRTHQMRSDQTFELLSGYFTGLPFNIGPSAVAGLEVQGLNGGTVLYDNSYILWGTSPVLLNFNYRGIDTVNFNIVIIGDGPIPIDLGNPQFELDNLTVNVPEPSVQCLLIGCGFVWLKRLKSHKSRAFPLNLRNED
jgi:hypothetical protein